MREKLFRFVQQLHHDADFRAAFATDPASALRECGIDPDQLALPATINLDALERRVRDFVVTIPDESDLSQKSAQQLWDDHAFIAGDTDDEPTTVAVIVNVGPSIVGPPVTSVIYGTTAVTNAVVAQITVTTVTGMDGRTSASAMNTLSALRELSRADPASLRFAVTDTDGLAVQGLSINAIKALFAVRQTRK